MEDQTEDQNSSSNGEASSEQTSNEQTSSEQNETSSEENTATMEQNTLTPVNGFPKELAGARLYDCISYVMVCKKHNKVAVKRDKMGSWLPFVTMNASEKWLDSAITGAGQILNHGDLTAYSDMERIPFKHPELLHLLRLQLPQDQTVVTRTIYYVIIRNDTEEDWRCCNDDLQTKWVLKDDVIAKKIENIWGPEVFTLVEHSKKAPKFTLLSEFFVEDATEYVPGEPRTCKEEDLLKSAKYGEAEIIKIYTDFFQHCWPSEFMCFHSFAKYMSKFGWNPSDENLHSVFRAFNYTRNGYISLHQILFGFAAMDQKTKHGGTTAELRCHYILRYYDSDNDDSLDFSDIVRMVTDINVAKKVNENTQQAAEARIKAMGKETSDKITFPEFIKAVADLKFAGTSVLFRSPYNVLEKL